jgi:hypothetical protein
MEKYGFVYIWRDRKHKRYYIGCRWGNENDGYICSSKWMKDSYKRRPNDFKRRTLSRVYTNKKDLLEEEYKWLSLIDSDDLGKKYYNLHNHKFNHWSTNKESKLSVGEKISLAHKKHPNWGHWSVGKTRSEETKQKLREANKKQFENHEQREMRKQKSLELWSDPGYRKINTENKIGVKQSEDQINKRVLACKEKWSSQGGKKRAPQTEEAKKAISKAFKEMIWITDGISNKRINKFNNIPEGFRRGKCKK